MVDQARGDDGGEVTAFIAREFPSGERSSADRRGRRTRATRAVRGRRPSPGRNRPAKLVLFISPPSSVAPRRRSGCRVGGHDPRATINFEEAGAHRISSPVTRILKAASGRGDRLSLVISDGDTDPVAARGLLTYLDPAGRKSGTAIPSSSYSSVTLQVASRCFCVV